MEYNELDVIKITVEHGFNGSEFKTKAWIDRGCLKPDRTHDALIEKLKTIYNVVGVVGKGKKRRYILDDKKEVQTQRDYNYKGTQLTEHDSIMREYIFYQLIKLSTSSFSFKGWADKLQLPNLISETAKINYVKGIKDFYVTKDEGIFNAHEIVLECISSVDSRNISVIRNSFRLLEKEKRLKVDEVFISSFKNYANKIIKESITEEKYNLIIEYIRSILSDYELTYYEYIKYLHNNTGSEKIAKVAELITLHLQNVYDVDRVYKSYKVTVIDTTILKNVTEEQFNIAYFSRLIKLSRDKQNRKQYIGSQTFWRRFYYLSMLLILKSSSYQIENIEQLFDEEYKSEELFITHELGTFDELFA
ncbi:hypothetical protein [Psychrobacillus sp. L3]|uniref:hypothetical protein n=1 Tax=Psychrobacillus sp. L3 TaxID=3236891 RepID=UPI0036F26C9A